MSVKIYALCDPDTLEVRYVGKAKDLAFRIRSHRWESRNQRYNTRKANWLRSLKGREPVVMVLAEVADDGWEEAERFWIAEMRDRGCDLTNHTDGGEGWRGNSHSEEAKQKMRNAALRNGAKPPSRKGLSSWNKGIVGSVKPNKTSFSKGQKAWNRGFRLTHCKNGHELTPENTRIVKRLNQGRTYQACRKCLRQAVNAYQKRKREVSIGSG